jgi:hypothetical protein
MTEKEAVYLDEIVALRARLASIEAAAGVDPAARVFTTDQLGDRAFYKAHEAEIHRALAEPGSPRIVESTDPAPRPAPVYPASVIPGWRAVGTDVFEAPAPAPKTTGDKP